jgi:radical SAM-linked protein
MLQNQESLGEYMDITLKQRVEPAEFMDVLRKHLPTGFGVAGVKEVPLRAPSLMFLARGAQYRIELPDTAEEVASRVDALRNQTDILVERRSKKKKNKGRTRTLNIRPSIRHIETDGATVQLTITETDGVRAKPREILGMLTGEPQGANVLRTETLTEREGAWMSIFESITPDNTPMGASE